MIDRKPLLLTLGEPAGIGPDCVLLAWQSAAEMFEDVIVAAPAGWLKGRAERLGVKVSLHTCTSLENDIPKGCLACWNPLSADMISEPVTVGKPSQATASAVIACIEAAANACLRGDAAALITAPIEKAVLRDSGFDFPGHTEFLASLSGSERVVMMLASEQLRVALLTTHMPLKDVSGQLNITNITHILDIIDHDLKHRFGIASPRLAVCGLNPHAGEQQHFGDEEQMFLAPAIEQAKSQGIDVCGPFPADTLFSPQIRNQYDSIVCCYHDQGLIPIKTLSFGEAVNITLGLPFIRTSVDHGTALDRAGSGKISYSSTMEAIKMARWMSSQSRHRQIYAD